MRYLIITILSLYLGYQVISRALVEPAYQLLIFTVERIANGS